MDFLAFLAAGMEKLGNLGFFGAGFLGKAEAPPLIWVGKIWIWEKQGKGWVLEGVFRDHSRLSTSFLKRGDFIHGKTWIGIPSNASCLNPIFPPFFFPNSRFLAPLYLGLSSRMPEFIRIYSQTLLFQGINPNI